MAVYTVTFIAPSQNGKELFNDLVRHSFPAVEHGAEIENGLLYPILVAEFDILA